MKYFIKLINTNLTRFLKRFVVHCYITYIKYNIFLLFFYFCYTILIFINCKCADVDAVLISVLWFLQVAYLQSSLDKLNEAIKLAKGQPDSVQEALRFTMDVIGGKSVTVHIFYLH